MNEPTATRDPAWRYTTCATPIGAILVATRRVQVALVRIVMPDGRFGPASAWMRDDAGLRGPREQVAAYFDGALPALSFARDEDGASPFFRRAWDAVARIPFGRTSTYADVARSLGSPRGGRAVGLAMNRNPFTLAVPCHRVVGSDGGLRGYLNGLDVKRALLDFEAHVAAGGAAAAFWRDRGATSASATTAAGTVSRSRRARPTARRSDRLPTPCPA